MDPRSNVEDLGDIEDHGGVTDALVGDGDVNASPTICTRDGRNKECL